MQIRGEFNVIFICAMPLLALFCIGGWKPGRPKSPAELSAPSPCSLTDECNFEELLVNMTVLSPLQFSFVHLSFSLFSSL